MRRQRRLRFRIPELSLAALLFAAPALAIPPWIFLANNQPSVISIPSDFGEIDCSSGAGHTGTCSSTSATKTLTVPAGNPGSIIFSIANGHTCQYSKNGGAFTTFTNGGTATFANGDSIAIKITGLLCGGDDDTVVLNDNTTSAYIGAFTASNQQGNCGP